MELVIYRPTEDGFLQNIEWNHEEIKRELAVRLEKYRDLVYSEDNMREAKVDRAALNKFKDAIETRRKEIKKQCLAPYEAFEAKVKEIVAMTDEPIKAIDGQVKAYEQIRKDEKLAAIKQFFSDKVADLEKLVPFNAVFNDKWLNVTYKEADIQKDITDTLNRVRNDLQALDALETPYLMQLKDFYLRGYDLTATLQEKKRLEEQAARIAEHEDKVRQEREKEREERREVALASYYKEDRNQPEDRVAVTEPEPDAKPQFVTVDFRVQATREQLAALKQFLVDSGIKYGRVPMGTDERRAI